MKHFAQKKTVAQISYLPFPVAQVRLVLETEPEKCVQLVDFQGTQTLHKAEQNMLEQNNKRSHHCLKKVLKHCVTCYHFWDPSVGVEVQEDRSKWRVRKV